MPVSEPASAPAGRGAAFWGYPLPSPTPSQAARAAEATGLPPGTGGKQQEEIKS